MIRKLTLWWKNYKSGGKEARKLRREMRRQVVKDNKKEIMRDLMTGHNLGDFEITKEDLSKILKLGDNPPYVVILDLYKKYRGNDLAYRQ
jgi:hypothetical protein